MYTGGPKNAVNYSEEIACEIFDRLASGETLNSICASDHMPSRIAIFYWVRDDFHGFAAKYSRARELQVHSLVDDMLQIAADSSNDWVKSTDPEKPGLVGNPEHIHRTRLRIDTMKWYACKVVPRMYGDRIQNQALDKNGDPADPAVPVVNLTIARE